MKCGEGGGARFFLGHPVTAGGADAVARAAARSAVRRLSVLVVEDEEAVRRAMALLARRLGHEVTTAGRFVEATERLAQRAARYDSLLVDGQPEEGRTGFDPFDTLRCEGQAC